MVKFNLLKGLIKEHGETLEDFAKVINKSMPTVQERMKGKTTFTVDEAFNIKLHYNLSDERFIDIFFRK
jgi:antitoxin component HigA of HigAB toxin-antitoxin module